MLFRNISSKENKNKGSEPDEVTYEINVESMLNGYKHLNSLVLICT